MIARTGLSGWIGPVPHLHFAALRYGPQMGRQSIPTVFNDYQGLLEHEELLN